MTAATICVTKLECGSLDALVAINGHITAVIVAQDGVWTCECSRTRGLNCPHTRELHRYLTDHSQRTMREVEQLQREAEQAADTEHERRHQDER